VLKKQVSECVSIKREIIICFYCPLVCRKTKTAINNKIIDKGELDKKS